MSRALTVAVLLLSGLFICETHAQPAVDFRGKTVNFVISFEAGGPYDLYGRLVARFIGPHLPGNPTVVVQNMPGAGGMVGINYLYNVAPKDGTSLGVVSQTVAIGQLLQNAPGIKYDVLHATWIGRINSNVEVLYTLSSSKLRSIQEAKQRQVVLAGTGPTSSSVIMPRIMNNLIHTHFKVVTGYQGPASAQLALERGEIEGTAKPWSAIKVESAEALRNKTLIPILQYSQERHPELSDVPCIVDLAETPEQRQIFSLFASGGSLGTSVLAPPNLAPGVTEVLRKAFMDTMNDPALREEIKKAKIDIDPLPGDALQKLAGEIFATPAAVVERAKQVSQN